MTFKLSDIKLILEEEMQNVKNLTDYLRNAPTETKIKIAKAFLFSPVMKRRMPFTSKLSEVVASFFPRLLEEELTTEKSTLLVNAIAYDIDTEYYTGKDFEDLLIILFSHGYRPQSY